MGQIANSVGHQGRRIEESGGILSLSAYFLAGGPLSDRPVRGRPSATLLSTRLGRTLDSQYIIFRCDGAARLIRVAAMVAYCPTDTKFKRNSNKTS